MRGSCGQITGSLTTPGYSNTVLRMGQHGRRESVRDCVEWEDCPYVVFDAIEGGHGWLCGGLNACRLARVSLSDWLAFQARLPGV